jgi:hypothetical protein
MNPDLPSYFKIEAVSMSVESQVRRPIPNFLFESSKIMMILQQVQCVDRASSLDALGRRRFTLTPVYRFFDDFHYSP